MTPSHHRVAVAYLTKDRCELSEQSIQSLLNHPIDIFLCDGSTTEEGKAFPYSIANSQANFEARIFVHSDVRGGPDAAVAYALTTMLKGGDYEYVGLVENDVLLHPDWFGPTMALFDRGRADGLGGWCCICPLLRRSNSFPARRIRCVATISAGACKSSPEKPPS